MKITILSPHRDDAAFSVGLAVEAWLQAGHAVEVVNCFTQSRYSPFGDLEFVHANDLRSYVTAMRHREDERWSRQYRPAVGLVELNLRDAPQRMRCGVDEVCTTAMNPNDGSLGKIRRALEKKKLDALVVPLGLGNHVDHVTTRVASSAGWGEGMPIAFYEDLPYAARPGAAETIQERVDEVARTAESGLVPVFASEVGNVEAAVARKRKLALCYDSQIDSEVTESIAQFCGRYGGRERLWANDAWRQSVLKGVAR